MITLTKSQAEIVNCRNRFRVVNCGRRFGKTTLAVIEMLGAAASRDGMNVAYIAPTYQQARDIAWQSLKNYSKDLATNVNESRLEITVKTKDGGKSRISLRGWESIETLRGQAFFFIVIDEIAQMRNFWVNWEEVIRPTLTDMRGSVLFISTPKGFNHFYDLYNKEAKDEDYKSFHFTSYDNPFLPVEELNKAKRELPEDRFAQEYMADFRKQEGLVYKEFKRSEHLFNPEQRIPGDERIAGIDFGFTNPCAVISIIKDYDNNYWVIDEYYKRQQTDEMIAEYVQTCGFNKIYADPESPSAIEAMRKRGLPIREVIKNKDSIKNGIDRIRELFKTNRLKISTNCPNLIWELETYSYAEKKDLKNDDENPIKENDHACLTGDTRILMSDGKEKFIKNIKIGDFVQTKKGQQKVIDWALTKKDAEIYKIELSNGYKLKGTKDHKVYTDKGKIAIDTLRYDDIIEILNIKQISLWKKQLSLITEDIIGMVDILLRSVDIKMAGKDYIKQFGNIIMEKSPKDFTFTIKIGTEQIIELIILKLWNLESIYQTIIKKIGKNKNLEKKLGKTLKMLDHLQKFGIHLNKGLNGIKNTEKNRGNIRKELKKFAKYVEKNIKLIFLQEADFAIRIVGRKHCGKENVYNITVEKEHNYYANGILVGNCDALRYALYMQTNIKSNNVKVKQFIPQRIKRSYQPR